MKDVWDLKNFDDTRCKTHEQTGHAGARHRHAVVLGADAAARRGHGGEQPVHRIPRRQAGSEEGSYLRLIDFVYHSNLGT